MKIELIMPYVLTAEWIQMAVDRYDPFVHPSTTLHGTDLSDAAPHAATAENTPQLVVEQAIRAQMSGADACIIDCFYEAGLEESREVLSIPIVGAGEASLLLAYGLRAPFAVLTSDREGLSVIPRNAALYGVASRLEQVVSVDLPWQQIPTRQQEALGRMEEEALRLSPSVRTIVVGCTDLAPLSPRLRDRLASRGRDIRVISPIGAAIGTAEMRVRLGA